MTFSTFYYASPTPLKAQQCLNAEAVNQILPKVNLVSYQVHVYDLLSRFSLNKSTQTSSSSFFISLFLSPFPMPRYIHSI